MPELVSELSARGHTVGLVHDVGLIPASDVTFLLSLSQIVPAHVRARSRNNIVVHESALPSGKGWSPTTWQVLQGAHIIPVSLFEAVERVDSGPIYARGEFLVSDVDLIAEIRAKQAAETVRLCLEFVDSYPFVLENAVVQDRNGETFYARRTPADSRLDPDRSIADQFNLLRVCDPDAYPAFFEMKGHRFKLILERMEG